MVSQYMRFFVMFFLFGVAGSTLAATGDVTGEILMNDTASLDGAIISVDDGGLKLSFAGNNDSDNYTAVWYIDGKLYRQDYTMPRKVKALPIDGTVFSGLGKYSGTDFQLLPGSHVVEMKLVRDNNGREVASFSAQFTLKSDKQDTQKISGGIFWGDGNPLNATIVSADTSALNLYFEGVNDSDDYTAVWYIDSQIYRQDFTMPRKIKSLPVDGSVFSGLGGYSDNQFQLLPGLHFIEMKLVDNEGIEMASFSSLFAVESDGKDAVDNGDTSKPPVEEDPVRVANLRWTAPQSRVDGSELLQAELDAYRIYYYLEDIEAEGVVVEIPVQDGNAISMEYALELPEPGSYVFAIDAIDANGLASQISEPVMVAVP